MSCPRNTLLSDSSCVSPFRKPQHHLQAYLRSIAVTALFASGTAWGASPVQIPMSPPPESHSDPADLIPWPVQGYSVFAPGSVVRVGDWLLDAPAGKHGFVQTQPDGQLCFEDKTPARFWGTTLCYGGNFPEKPEEDAKLADMIASSGYNLVRFHHHDGWISYIQNKPASNYQLDPKRIDRLDHLAAEFYKRGIYVYFDFCDDKELTAEDGIEDWKNINKVNGQGWKGLFPHPQVVAAWKRGVTELMRHTNPYTGRTWAQEPGLATVEIINENGLFWDWNFKLTPGMQQWHDQQWNQWLLQKYKTRENLDRQWTDLTGAKGLFEDEDPAKGTVFQPRLAPLLEWDRPYHSRSRGAARVNDCYLFLAESATNFYKDATQHIRSLGFKGVIVGSHELQGPMNQYAEVQGTGTIAAHLYATGLPAWNARPNVRGAVTEGVDVKTRNWFSNMPRIKVAGAPGINGEWTGGTLTQHADVNVAVAAISSFQQITQSLHFAFLSRWQGEKVANFNTQYQYIAWAKQIQYSYNSFHDEPWGAVNRVCAPLFIRHDFSVPRARVDLAYSLEDRHEQNLHALGLSGGAGTIGDAATFLPLLHTVQSVFFDQAYEGDADVVFMTGRTASGDYRKARHAVLVGDNPFTDRYHKQRDLGVPARFVHPQAKIVTLEQPTTFTVEQPWESPQTLSFDRLEGAIELASIPPGATPIGRSADGRYTLGWLDKRFLVLPNGRAFQTRIKDRQWLYRLYLAACQRWQVDVADNGASKPFYRSDTREFTVDWGSGTVILDTPRTQGFSGFPGWREDNTARNISCKLESPYGNVLLTSADGKPLADSHRMLLVAAGRIQNTGEELSRNSQGSLAITKTGKAPSLIEALRGQVQVTSAHSGTLQVFALDSEGRRLGKVETTQQNGRLVFSLSPKWGTFWFELCTPEITGPAVDANTAWPLPEQPRSTPVPTPQFVNLQEFLTPASPAPAAEKTASNDSAQQSPRVVVQDFSEPSAVRTYGNIKTTIAEEPGRGQVVNAQFGKVNKEWYGGLWTMLAAPSGLKPGDCLGLGFSFKGDGTLPKDAYINLKTTSGVSYRSEPLRKIFENDAWQEVFIPDAEFTLEKASAAKHPEAPQHPDWSTVNRLDFSVSGPLMDQASVGRMGACYFRLARMPETLNQKEASLLGRLPAATVPPKDKIEIPWVADAAIQADGQPGEAAWKKAFGLSLDERHVPAWQFFGSHVVEGHRLQEEGATFWLLATLEGLAVTALIHKGQPEVVTEKSDWYASDCLEIFSDPANKNGRPAKQLFLAYRRPGVDRAAASDPGIQIGRSKVEAGYVLEAVIPWQTLGFSGAPEGEFRLEFQVDFAQKDAGRVLQMAYGTGTNEAWIKTDHYLKVVIAR